MIAPKLEVLLEHPHAFRMRVVTFEGRDDWLRIERWNGEKAGDPPTLWRMLYRGRIVIESRGPIVVNGLDPFEVLRDRVQCNVPGCVAVLDMHGTMGREFLLAGLREVL